MNYSKKDSTFDDINNNIKSSIPRIITQNNTPSKNKKNMYFNITKLTPILFNRNKDKCEFKNNIFLSLNNTFNLRNNRKIFKLKNEPKYKRYQSPLLSAILK